MAKIDDIVREVSALPPEKLAEVERLLASLREEDNKETHDFGNFSGTHGVITDAEADNWLRAARECRPTSPAAS